MTLPELLVALVLSGIIGTTLLRFSVQLGHSTTKLQARALAATALDQGLTFLSAEVGEAAPGDISAIAGDAISYRGYRGSGLACAVTATRVSFTPERGGGRSPQPGRDSLLLLLTDEGWSALPIVSVQAATCDGAAALAIETLIDPVTLAKVDSALAVPVRIFETMQARLYQSSGDWWLGARSLSGGEAVQPLAGPFAANPGGWEFRDHTGAVTTDPAAVARFIFRLASPEHDSAVVLLQPVSLRP